MLGMKKVQGSVVKQKVDETKQLKAVEPVDLLVVMKASMLVVKRVGQMAVY
jgi:hypothetical protein